MSYTVPYLIMPNAADESWDYIPVDFTPPEAFTGDPLLILRDARLYHFGVLGSSMHMAWIRHAYDKNSGNHETRPKLHQFPWPINHTQAQLETIEERARDVLNIRAYYSGTPMSELYHPLTMPQLLLEAHEALDAAVDAAYRRIPFRYRHERVSFLTRLDRQLAEMMVVDRGRRSNILPEKLSERPMMA